MRSNNACFGNDHRHDRLVARADILRAAPDDDAAVGVDLALGARARARTAPPVCRAA
jgi:hypothetical protein